MARRVRRNPDDTLKFSELSPQAKEKAIVSFRDNCDFDWFADDADAYISDVLVPELEALGIEVKSDISGRGYAVQWSGFWSQGDGLSFEATFEPWDYIAANNLESIYPDLMKFRQWFGDDIEVYGDISRNSHRYSHWKTVGLSTTVAFHRIDYDSAEAFDEDFDEIEARAKQQGEEILEDIAEFCEDKMKEAYRQLEIMYESTISDESIVDMIEANEYDFYPDGTWTGARRREAVWEDED